MQLSLEAIKFNHDPLSATVDAINIRKNGSEAVTVPEWQRRKSGAPKDSLAAYAISETQGNKITIQAKFKCDPGIKSLEIRAIDPSRNFMLAELDDLVDTVFSWLNPAPRLYNNILGRAKKRRVKFGENGESNFETFELDDVRIWSTGVSVSSTTWQWQYHLKSEDPWITFEISHHRIYTILKLPTDPWTQSPSENDNINIPWGEVLDHACIWADGARSIDEAAVGVTRELRRLETTRCIVYDTHPFYSYGNFDCTGFLSLVRDGMGKGSKLNCSDCATVVSTFANILGCELWQVALGGRPDFRTNLIRLFGRTCWRKVTFVEHEVAWDGGFSENAEVFDASLQVDGDDDPTKEPFRPVLPADMRFGKFLDMQYLFRFAAPPEDQPEGLPFPVARTRRAIRPNRRSRSAPVRCESLRFLRSHYNYPSWRRRFSAKERLFIANLFPSANDFPDWVFVDEPETVVTIDLPPVIQLLFRVKLGRQMPLMRLDVDVCRSERAARHFLLRRLTRFQFPNLEERKDLNLGEVVFTEPEQGAVIFARANLVVLLRIGAHTAVDFAKEARRFDRHLTRNPQTEGERTEKMKQFSIPDGVFRVGDIVPLKSLTEDVFGTNRPIKFFTSSGFIRQLRTGFVYQPTRAGRSKITIFSSTSTGRVLVQNLALDVGA